MKLCKSTAERIADGKIPKKVFCLMPTMCDDGSVVWLEYVWMTETYDYGGCTTIYKRIEEKRMYV